uniref:Uncharacterized protein n=1 Tax=Anguilla anguilla TaxID=7936 RepID=A0A0E9TH97_ANGAN
MYTVALDSLHHSLENFFQTR